MNIVTLDRAKQNAATQKYLFEDEYRLLVVLLVAKVDGWILENDATQELERLIAKAQPEDS